MNPLGSQLITIRSCLVSGTVITPPFRSHNPPFQINTLALCPASAAASLTFLTRCYAERIARAEATIAGLGMTVAGFTAAKLNAATVGPDLALRTQTS
jgi:hypothetical protein